MTEVDQKLTRTGPSYCLVQKQRLPAPRSDVFEFFSNPYNLETMTPDRRSFRVLSVEPEPVQAGTRIAYRLTVWWFVPMGWTSEITLWNPEEEFRDRMVEGPYASWLHVHRFEQQGEETLAVDEVEYRLPLDPLSRLVHPFTVGLDLKSLFRYRAERLEERFGSG